MDAESDKLTILVVGATGKLGSLITKHCLTKSNLIVNILVRNPEKNKELMAQVEKAGGKVIKADLAEPETLKGVTKGIHTIIFAVSWEEHILVDGQMAIINDGVANGVQRVIPTEYSENFDKFSEKELSKVPVIVNRFKIRKYLESLPLKTLRIDGAIFIESFYQQVLGKEFGYWGDPHHKYQLTSYEDTAKFVAALVAKKDQYGYKVFVANEATIDEVAEIYNKVRGTHYTPTRLGSLNDLDARAEELEEKNDPSAWLLRFSRLFSDERSRFEKIDNDEFQEVKGTSIEEVLKQRQDIVA